MAFFEAQRYDNCHSGLLTATIVNTLPAKKVAITLDLGPYQNTTSDSYYGHGLRPWIKRYLFLEISNQVRKSINIVFCGF